MICRVCTVHCTGSQQYLNVLDELGFVSAKVLKMHLSSGNLTFAAAPRLEYSFSLQATFVMSHAPITLFFR